MTPLFFNNPRYGYIPRLFPVDFAQQQKQRNSILKPLNKQIRKLSLYCATDYFNYQTTDLAKGLLAFSKCGVIGRRRAVAYHLLYLILNNKRHIQKS